MQAPVQVTFRDMPVSDDLEALCWEEVEKLERFFKRITSCRIVVAESQDRRRPGNLFEVRIDLTLPGGEVVVNDQPSAQRDEDPVAAVREAFARTRRRLEEHFQRRRDGVWHPQADL